MTTPDAIHLYRQYADLLRAGGRYERTIDNYLYVPGHALCGPDGACWSRSLTDSPSRPSLIVITPTCIVAVVYDHRRGMRLAVRPPVSLLIVAFGTANH